MNTGAFGKISALMEEIDMILSTLGLDDLTTNERAVLFAMTAAAVRHDAGVPICHTEGARRHRLVRHISQPTFHRNLRKLHDRGLIEKGDGLSAGEYRIRVPADPG